MTGGQRQWDFALLKLLPELLAAKDRETVDAIPHRWIVQLGPVADCKPCATWNQQDFQLPPNLTWLDDTRLLSPALRNALSSVPTFRAIWNELQTPRA
ncbi:hypothetical protein JN27_15990 [Massilia sp. BSC265]|nr:hypothetical protein JN27_15990 [Massilia sp. BSC265]